MLLSPLELHSHTFRLNFPAILSSTQQQAGMLENKCESICIEPVPISTIELDFNAT